MNWCRSMSRHDAGVTLAQLLDFIREARQLAAGTAIEKILHDQLTLRAFERVMELVGEAVKRLPGDVKEEAPEIPWKKISGMRDVISHGNEDVQYEVLWDAVQLQFPELEKTVRSLLDKHRSN